MGLSHLRAGLDTIRMSVSAANFPLNLHNAAENFGSHDGYKMQICTPRRQRAKTLLLRALSYPVCHPHSSLTMLTYLYILRPSPSPACDSRHKYRNVALSRPDFHDRLKKGESRLPPIERSILDPLAYLHDRYAIATHIHCRTNYHAINSSRQLSVLRCRAEDHLCRVLRRNRVRIE